MSLFTLLTILGESFQIRKVGFRILQETTCISLRACSLCDKLLGFDIYTKVFFTPVCLIPVLFNACYLFTLLLNLRPLIFG